ncbi:argininosuccinate synthase [Salininema proteolyticum]|uniref:Argininosuccinate synthase n=1 Tax=Salininema proteolyticum TaxID=1607685 RepID=A0ABV8U482_9ACTN
MKDRIVLAYSGGLDASVAIPRLSERLGAEVVAVAVDVGRGGASLDAVRERALGCGAVEAEVVDAREEFASEYCFPAVAANSLGMDRPLASALLGPLIAEHLAAAATRHGATAVGHGWAGRGRDRVRFEAGLAALAPDLEIVAPVPETGWTRDKAVAFAEERGLPIDAAAESPCPADRDPRGRAAEHGPREDRWNGSFEDLFSRTGNPAEDLDPDEVAVTFDGGRPVALDGETKTPRELVDDLDRRAGAQGVGRTGAASDRPAGLQGREAGESPAGIALTTAHMALESVTLEREQARFKRTVDRRWSEAVYDGLWFSPLKNSLEAFIDETQGRVTGEVRLTLHRGRIAVTGRRSEEDLYDSAFAACGGDHSFDRPDARAFAGR